MKQILLVCILFLEHVSLVDIDVSFEIDKDCLMTKHLKENSKNFLDFIKTLKTNPVI